jgi:hypothetical protein
MGMGLGASVIEPTNYPNPITLIVPGSVGWVKEAVSWDQKSCLDRSVSMPTESPQPANLRASVRGMGGLWAYGSAHPETSIPGNLNVEQPLNR